MAEFLSRDHSILERRFMEFPPFACNTQGEEFSDIAGVVIEANVEYLYDPVSVQSGPAVAKETVDKLCRLLNGRIRNSAYHVTPEMLRNPCNWYSQEFSCYLREFCEQLSGDPEFHFKAGARIVPPTILDMLRTFAVPQIYNRWPSVGSKFASKESLQFGIEKVTRRSAILWMKYTDKALQQFGPYRNRCIEVICESCRGGIAGALRPIHGMACASAHHVRCTARGHDRCEWHFFWTLPAHIGLSWFWCLLISYVSFASVHWWVPGLSIPLILGMSIIPTACVWLAMTTLQRGQTQKLQAHIRELAHILDQNQQESCEVAKKRQRIEVELQRKITQLTTLNQAGLACSSIVDREQLIKEALSAVVKLLHHDRAMLTFYDRQRQVIHGARLLGVRPEITRLAESLEVPVTDPSSLEGRVFLQGKEILIDDIADVLDQMDRRHRELAERLGTQSFISVPLKIKDRVLGAITVDRTRPYALTEDDMKVMITVANQLAVAFDKLVSDERREALTANLEELVRERTAQLESANAKLQEISTRKSELVSDVFHDLSQPMAAIRGIAENMLRRVAGPITEKQVNRLRKIISEVDRVMNSREAHLYLAKMESDTSVLQPEWIDLEELVDTVAESFRETVREKSIALDTPQPAVAIRLEADRSMLTRILSNLLENAVKFAPRGGTIQVLTSILSNGFVCVHVTDTGCGIAPDEIPKIFDKRFRGSSATETIPGSGLGLDIVKRLVELHGGTIGVESQIGEGSSFLVLLPVRQSSSSPEAT